MSDERDLGAIKPGMPVVGVDGASLGQVESVDGDGNLRVMTHVVPSVAVARVDGEGVHLHIAAAAFEAATPETRE